MLAKIVAWWKSKDCLSCDGTGKYQSVKCFLDCPFCFFGKTTKASNDEFLRKSVAKNPSLVRLDKQLDSIK